MKTNNIETQFTEHQIKVFKSIIEDSTQFCGMCEDASNFIIENVYSDDDSVINEAFFTAHNLRGLVALFTQLKPQENEN